MRTLVCFATAAVSIAACGFLIGLATERYPALSARLLRYYWFRLTDVALPLASAFLAVGCVAALINKRPRLGAFALAMTIAIPVWHISPLTVDQVTNPVPRGDRRLANDVDWPHYVNWLDACQWIKANTAKDAGFIVPRLAQTFHWHAGRREAATHKNIPQNAEAIIEWQNRIEAIYRWHESDHFFHYPNLSHRTAGDLIALGERFDVGYLLTQDERPLALPLEYSNRTYAIYRLSTARDRTSKAP
jgi:hypothetical protein